MPLTAAELDRIISTIPGATTRMTGAETKAAKAAVLEQALLAWKMARPEDETARALRQALLALNTPDHLEVRTPSTWKPDPKWPKFYRQDQACVYEANGRWHAYLMCSSGFADNLTDDREDLDDGLGIGERELSFATAEEGMGYVDRGYPITTSRKAA